MSVKQPENANQWSPRPDKIERGENPSDRAWRRQRPVRIDQDLCDSSGVCVMVCPEDVIEANNGHTHVVKPAACTECWICVENCASGAIDII